MAPNRDKSRSLDGTLIERVVSSYEEFDVSVEQDEVTGTGKVPDASYDIQTIAASGFIKPNNIPKIIV